MAEARGCSLARSAAAATRSSRRTAPGIGIQRLDRCHLRPAAGQSARLVQDDVGHPGRVLDGCPVPDQDAGLRSSAGGDHQGGWRGQAHGARAGDDQHSDRRRKGQREARLRPEDHPGRERDGRHGGHGRDEPGHDPVDGPLDRWLRALRRADQPRDLGQRGVGAQPVGADEQGAVGVQRPAGHPVADDPLDRDRLAGEHRLVDGAAALDHDAVDRHPFPWADPDQVACGHLGERHLHLAAVTDHPRDGGLEAEKSPHRAGRLRPWPGPRASGR